LTGRDSAMRISAACTRGETTDGSASLALVVFDPICGQAPTGSDPRRVVFGAVVICRHAPTLDQASYACQNQLALRFTVIYTYRVLSWTRYLLRKPFIAVSHWKRLFVVLVWYQAS
jgi:hypothetical protein